MELQVSESHSRGKGSSNGGGTGKKASLLLRRLVVVVVRGGVGLALRPHDAVLRRCVSKLSSLSTVCAHVVAVVVVAATFSRVKQQVGEAGLGKPSSQLAMLALASTYI